MAKKALNASRLNAFAMDPTDLTIVGYDTEDGPEHPLWDDRVEKLESTMYSDFVDSIIEQGVLQPVRVRKNGEVVEVVVGRRRTLGARLANKRLAEVGGESVKVPTMLYRGKDTSAQSAVLIENEQRVNDSPLVLARKIARLEQRADMRTAAKAAGVSPAEAKRLLRLLDLADPVAEMVDDGRLRAATALTLLDLPRDEQTMLAKTFADAKTTIAAAKAQAKERKAKASGDSAPAAKLPGAAKIRRVADAIRDRHGVGDSALMLQFIDWIIAGDDPGASETFAEILGAVR